MYALELIGVSKRFGSRSALRAVDLAVEPGSALGLLGPNGAGKTTALRLCLGFARPTEGQVRLRGVDPMRAEARVGVAYLPERLRLPPRMTVRAFLRLHGRLAGVDPARLDDEIDEVLGWTGLSDRVGDRLGGLSKGLSQRVGFAQAFLARPQLMLLDEPTSGLDPVGIRDARDWIARTREWGCTTVVSSHVLSEVERTCDRVVIVHEGTIRAEGAIEDLVSPEESLEDVFVRMVTS